MRRPRVAGVIRRDIRLQPQAFSLADLDQQAAETLAAARSEAARIIASGRAAAIAELENAREEARRLGFEAGRAEGRKAAEASGAELAEQLRRDSAEEIKSLAAALRTAMAEFERRRHAVSAEAEFGMVRLALAIAERVCGFHAEHSHAAAEANVRKLLEMVRGAGNLQVRVNPADVTALERVVSDLRREHESLSHAALIADSQVPRGGAKLTTTDGWMDATIQTQISRIAAELVGADEASAAAPQIAEPPKDAERPDTEIAALAANESAEENEGREPIAEIGAAAAPPSPQIASPEIVVTEVAPPDAEPPR